MPSIRVNDSGSAQGESTNKSTVVISDVHIGNDAPTCWYQKKYHEPYLLNFLQWILDARSSQNIGRLFILGDLFDFWTYKPEVPPPTLAEIVDANPRILGPNGKLAEVVEALNGNVLYLRGNHDINITQDDLNTLTTGTYKIKFVDDDFYYNPAESGIVFTHGHRFTMFNAPDRRYPGEVPVGHFVTRAIAHMVDTICASGPIRSAAELRDQGSPYGYKLDSIVSSLYNQLKDPSVTNYLLDYIAQRTLMDPNVKIKMAKGDPMSINDAKDHYKGLFDDWVEQFGGGEFGYSVAAKSARADYDGAYMGWFALKTVLEKSAAGLIMGHTHIPRVGIVNGFTTYVNNGFDCPAFPDIQDGRAQFNFTVITDDQMRLKYFFTDSDGETFLHAPATAQIERIVFSPFEDYSTYVTIRNNSDCTLQLTSKEDVAGRFVVPPPATIPPGSTARFWNQDLAGIRGAEGRVFYNQVPAGGGSGPFHHRRFIYGCTTISLFDRPNYAQGGDEFFASTTTLKPANESSANSVPQDTHPLFLTYTVNQTPSARANAWEPTSIVAKMLYACGFLYDPEQDIIYSRMDPLQRSFGYAYGYDAAALLGMSTVFDCEPIFFKYNNKDWMIELWKGQYGIETGCEIGVYNRPASTSGAYALLDNTIGQRTNDNDPTHNQFFFCVGDDERLTMSFSLKRNGKVLFSRGPTLHWWLTGFRWGEYSEPEELTMDVSFTFPDKGMYQAFAAAVSARGYTNLQKSPDKLTVSFTFDTPKTHQPRSDAWDQVVKMIRAANKNWVDLYNSFKPENAVDNDPNVTLDRAINVVMGHIADYAASFFGSAVASLAMKAGIELVKLFTTLVDGLKMLVDEAVNLISLAGYGLKALQEFLGFQMNFSCVGEISNVNGQCELYLHDLGKTYGDYTVRPPARIKVGSIGQFILADSKVSDITFQAVHGAEGWVEYRYYDDKGEHIVRFSYDCPTGFSSYYPNKVETKMVGSSDPSPFTFFTKTDANAGWSNRGDVPKGGHPLYMAFVWGQNFPIAAPARVEEFAPAVGQLSSFLLMNNPRVYYIGGDGKVHELGWDGQKWLHRDLNAAAAGNPVDAAGGGLTSGTWGIFPVVYYIGVDGHVHQLVFLGQEWLHVDLNTVAADDPVDAAAASAPTSVTILEPVYYIDRVGHIHELALEQRYIGALVLPNASLIRNQIELDIRLGLPIWEHTDLNKNAKGDDPPVDAAAASAPTSWSLGTKLGRNSPRAYYIGVDGRVHELRSDGKNWWHGDLNKEAKGKPEPAVASSALTSYVLSGNLPRVYYIGVDGHVHELWSDGQNWWHNDLNTAAAGNPVDAAANGGLTSFAWSNTTTRVYYIGKDDGHVHELGLSGKDWFHTDVTANAKGDPVVKAAANSGLTSFAWNNTTTRVYYVGVHGHVHELGWNGGDWWHTDVTRMVSGS